MFNQKDYLKKWHQEHPNYQNELRKKNLDKIRKRDRDYYYRNRERQKLTINKQWNKKKDSYNLQRRIRYQKDKIIMLQKNKLNFKKNGKKYYQNQKSYQQKWRKENPDKVLEWSTKLLKNQAKDFNLSIMEYKMALMAWSKAIRKRDVVCQVCGTSKTLQAHHIIHRSKNPKLSFILNNGITLCRNCHYEAHDKNFNI